MINFLKETIDGLAHQGKTVDHVLWVGSSDGSRAMSWQDFALMADFQYDNGYGGHEIDLDLVVVGAGWWLERHEYDGSEGWSFKSIPVKKAGRPFVLGSTGPHCYVEYSITHGEEDSDD